jgi:hypothetical protein
MAAPAAAAAIARWLFPAIETAGFAIVGGVAAGGAGGIAGVAGMLGLLNNAPMSHLLIPSIVFRDYHRSNSSRLPFTIFCFAGSGLRFGSPQHALNSSLSALSNEKDATGLIWSTCQNFP